tara:strand:+ start:259 stop:540 length:282 start_codon:yes stop_codon:yes gene_type:complete
MASKVKYTAAEALNVKLGQAGTVNIASGSGEVTPSSGDFVVIHCIADGDITVTGKDSNWPTGTITCKAGTSLYGRYSAVESPGGGGTFLVHRG